MKQFSATYVRTLKDAMVAAFWYKNELKDFLRASLNNPKIVETLDWNSREKKKRDIVEDLFAKIVRDERSFASDIDCLSRGVLEITHYHSLEKLEDSAYRLAEAAKTKEALRACVDEHKKNLAANKKLIEYDFFKAEYDRRKKEDEERSRRRAAEDELRKKNPAKYYGQVLRLEGKISRETIKERYRDLMKLYHPDKFSSLDEEFVELATARTQRINEAYRYLADKFGIE